MTQDVDRLAEVISTRFGHVSVRRDYGWPGKPAVCVLDCILSLNRRYDRVVYPRVSAFVERHPACIELGHLRSMLDAHDEVGEFCRQHLNYNDPRRERTLRGVVDYLFREQHRHGGATEWERFQAWAASARPEDHFKIGVSGFGLSGLQYLRMLFGVQTTKPDVHVTQFVSAVVGRRVNDVTALALLEAAAAKARLPLREVDGAIWEAGARSYAPVTEQMTDPKVGDGTTPLAYARKAVAKLSSDEFAQFREWFAEYDGDRWDAQIEADAEAGKLDGLAREALAEYEAGRTPEI